MITETFKCNHCGWIGTTPIIKRLQTSVTGGRTFIFCPECTKRGERKEVVRNGVIRDQRYMNSKDPNLLCQTAFLHRDHDLPAAVYHYLFNNGLFRRPDLPAGRNNEKLMKALRKANVDALTRYVNSRIAAN